MWKIKLIYENNSRRSLPWVFVAEASTQTNAIDISKKYLLNFIITDETKIKWLICEEKNISKQVLFRFLKITPKGEEGIRDAYLN